MLLHYFDDNPAGPGEKHGPLGPTHCHTVGKHGTIEYAYQAEQYVIEADKDYPEVVRIECPEMGRVWKRVNGTFEEVT
jgi:hypothetical protein